MIEIQKLKISKQGLPDGFLPKAAKFYMTSLTNNSMQNFVVKNVNRNGTRGLSLAKIHYIFNQSNYKLHTTSFFKQLIMI